MRYLRAGFDVVNENGTAQRLPVAPTVVRLNKGEIPSLFLNLAGRLMRDLEVLDFGSGPVELAFACLVNTCEQAEKVPPFVLAIQPVSPETGENGVQAPENAP